MKWRDGIIGDCLIQPAGRYTDDRGWLTELFRDDELPGNVRPAMGYLSLTHPGVARGPHAHYEQTDLFVFFDGRFRVYLWDARPESATEGVRQVFVCGRENPVSLIVPPGVVHAYRNEGEHDALIVNCPDRLYGGRGRNEVVDEIRYEDQPDTPYRLEP